MQSPGAFCIVPPDTQKAAHTGRLSFCHEIRKTLENQGFRAETEGFEPSYRDEPINAFRVFYSQHTLADFEKKCPILRVNALVRKKWLPSPFWLLPTVRNARELSERTNRTAIKHNNRKSP